MEEWLQMQDSRKEKIIEITVHSIENVITKEDINMSFIVEHNDIVLGESKQILIDSHCTDELKVHNIDFIVKLSVIVEDKESLNSIVSIPALIKAMQYEHEQEVQSIASNVEVKKRSIFSTKSASPVSSILLGMCNLDLMPLILGEPNITEKLILETPSFSFDDTSVSWQNLPRLTISATQSYEPFLQENELFNILYITVESIYNIPETFTENFQYRAGTIAYTDDEVPKNIIFDQGIWTKYRDVERTKRWNTLPHIENRARLSKYKLDYDLMGVRNEFKKHFDLAKKMCEDVPRIEWNSLHRCLLWEKGMEAMRNHIRKYKYWPIQFELSGKTSSTKSKGSTLTTQLYQCYIDLSELLFPGRRSCRTVGQLYKYNPSDISEKVGLEQNIFIAGPQRKELKDKDKRSKTSKNTQSIQSEIEIVLPEKVVAESGEPTLVVIEIELCESLIACQIKQDFENLISEMIPKVEKRQQYVYNRDVAEAQYTHCIQKIAEVLTECYRDFRDENKKKNVDEDKQEKYCFDAESDELTCFTQYLYKTGMYLTIRNTLRLKIPMLIDQKFEMPENVLNYDETHNFIATIYTYLVEQMHLAINNMVEGRFTEDLAINIDVKTIYFYAEEAFELGDVDIAKQYYRKIIAANKSDPDSWTQYAVFLKKIGDMERAKECCLEAIVLNQRYVIALLVYAMILFEDKRYEETEIFLRAITDLQPRFFEGWVLLHLFYIRTEYCSGMDLTLRIAKKCMQDKTQVIKIDQEPLSWTTIHCPPENVYMVAAVFLLKLNFCEFAGLALAEEMSNSNRSIHVLYYMAVQHYLSGRYEDALSHLEEIRYDYGMDYSISSLMGHCCYKMGDFKKEVEYYEFARMLFDRPKDLHLIEVRLGYHYYDVGDFNRATKIFLNVCKTSPSCVTWLGAGMSCYEVGQFREAEMSLSEANRIDNHNPEVWGYLCLLNMSLGRYDEFAQCYAEMIKYQNNLKNRKLWLRITDLMKALDYAPPNLKESDDVIEEYSTEESEEQFEN